MYMAKKDAKGSIHIYGDNIGEAKSLEE